MTTSYSNQGVDVGVSRVRTQCGHSQPGKANESGGIPEKSELSGYLPDSVALLTREPHGIIHKHLDQLREKPEIKEERFTVASQTRGLMF